MLKLFSEIAKNRELIWALAMKDLRVRYKRSTLGFFWALLNPLLMMLVYIIIFSTLLGGRVESYPVFLISGIFPWTFFAQGITYSVSSIIGNSMLIKKVHIDQSVFPISTIVANLINFAFSLIAMSTLILALRYPFHWTWVYFPIPLFCLVMITLGLGFIFSAVNVFFRDVAHMVEILLRAGFFLSGIIYTIDIVPAKFLWILKVNPMLYVIGGFQKVIYYGSPPDPANLAIAFSSSLVILIFGYVLFCRVQDLFVYYL